MGITLIFNICILSFDETGEFDLPAMIDKVRETSGQEKIFYVGHSMGTTSFMVSDMQCVMRV